MTKSNDSDDVQRVEIPREQLSQTSLEREASRLTHREEIISVIAHDLRNPLSCISLNASLILQDISSVDLDRTRDRIKAIQRRCDEMTRLISSLLDAEFITAGKMPVNMRNADVCEDVHTTVNDFLPLAEHKGIYFECHTPEHPCMVKCDPSRICQVMSNLVSNAIKYAPNDTIVKVKLTQQDEDVLFTIESPGPVIAPENREAVFDRYVRLEYNAQQIAESRGLGLWISRWIVTQHGGKIWVEPTPGADGNIFKFTLPR